VPEFERPMPNMTVTAGQNATLTCHVANLGGYKVGWINSDNKAIQAIHTHVITHNPRVSGWPVVYLIPSSSPTA